MTIEIDGIKIDADCEEALSIAHDIDALVNELDDWAMNDGDNPDWRGVYHK